MLRRHLVSAAAVLLLAAFGIASAQNAYTSRPMNVRAGPDREYPLVAQLGPGAPLDVHGCLSDWSWCDVSFDDSRGWIYAGGVSFAYQGERVPLYSYAPRLGLPIIAFSVGAYWNQYYRGRPWYSQRDAWARRRFPPHMRPPRRPGTGTVVMPHARPAPAHQGRLPMPNARQPVVRPPTPRAGERGRMAPPQRGATPERGAQRPQSGHSRPQAGHPPGARGRSDQGGHGHEQGHRPP
jgi:uncharacterized protein YraI